MSNILDHKSTSTDIFTDSLDSSIIPNLSKLHYLGEEVIGAKFQVTELDKIRQKTREAWRKLDDTAQEKRTCIICNDKLMLRLPTTYVKSHLQKEAKLIDIEIENARTVLKEKVDDLKKFEGTETLEKMGFSLEPINKRISEAEQFR
uniref:BED-type domain-containing protein n=1 Tax=Rhabditophanes sp. KR3021 TaxID=114890 RepID=A0AC35TUH9_9BILA